MAPGFGAICRMCTETFALPPRPLLVVNHQTLHIKGPHLWAQSFERLRPRWHGTQDSLGPNGKVAQLSTLREEILLDL